MPNRPTSAQGGDVSAIHDALRRFSTVLPNYHGLPVSQAKCLNSIQSPHAATKLNHPTIGVVPFASRTFFSYTKPYHLPSLGETNYPDYVAADIKAITRPMLSFFNKPLLHYGEMLTIFGSTMATGKFAKDSSSVLGTEDVETENEKVNRAPTTIDLDPETSSASKPKKAKTIESEDDGLIRAITNVGDKLAAAIVKAGEPDNTLPVGLFDTLKSLPGFQDIHLSFYYAYLVANPHIARAFNGLPFENKLHWVAMFISDKFTGSM
ncbi:hypothetical protein DAI22_05g276700 [Oryza sativa Japonica Group]|nr:hypothetical protein DAI22_05g276700 [Oryza sativa Japonica Group]